MIHMRASRGVSVQTRSWGGRARARFLQREGGQALVEMALCLPVLMLIVTGLLTFSVALNNYLELSNAVTMGGRALASSRGATDPCSAASTAVYQAAPFLNHGTTVLTMTYVFYDKAHNTLGSGSGKSCTADASNMVPNGSVQLTLTYPCNLSVFGYQFVPGCKMETQTTEYLQ